MDEVVSAVTPEARHVSRIVTPEMRSIIRGDGLLRFQHQLHLDRVAARETGAAEAERLAELGKP